MSGHDQILVKIVWNWNLIVKTDPAKDHTQAHFSIFPELWKFIDREHVGEAVLGVT